MLHGISHLRAVSELLTGKQGQFFLHVAHNDILRKAITLMPFFSAE